MSEQKLCRQDEIPQELTDEISAKFHLVSIIVPVYNILEYLPRCVRSITAQTYENLEIILVDDGSTDGTGQLCDSLSKEDARIRVFHKENGGSSSARNYGIAHAGGEYLGFVDSDDYVAPDMYERLVKALLKSGKGIAQIGRDEIDEDGNRLPDLCVPPEKEQEISYEDFLKELFMHRGDCSFCTKLIKRNLLGTRRFPEGVLNEDFHLLVELLAEEQADVISLPGYGYHVFYRSGSNTRKKDPETFSRVYADNVDNALMVVRLAEEKLPRLKKEAFRFCVIQHLDYMLHIPISRMNREEDGYLQKVKWLRKSWPQAMHNPYLSVKNRLYHTLLALAPKGVRKIHEKKMKRKA